MKITNRINQSLKHRVRYLLSPTISQIFSKLKKGNYGHGPRLTQPQPLIDLGISVESVTFNIDECWDFWKQLSQVNKHLDQLVSKETFWDKIPQYYFSFKSIEHILNNPNSVYVDIASTGISPYQEVITLLAKTQKRYLQDLSFPTGINGNKIGGSAANIPLPNASVDAMTLHCSFEHFEGNADIGFIREVGRLLRPRGRVCIVPLYLGEYAFVVSDPAWALNLSVDKDAVIQFFPRWGQRHGRFYSPETLLKRIIEPAKEAGLLPRVIHFSNTLDLDPSCYTHFVLILDKT